MKLLEIYLWTAVYWAIYLLGNIALKIFTGKGTFLATIAIGLFFSAILSIYLKFQESLIEKEEPAIILDNPPTKKRGRKRKITKESNEEGVKKDENEQESTGSEMRTDVDLSKLDAPDEILG